MDGCIAQVVSRLATPTSAAVQEQAQSLIELCVASEKPEFKENANTWAVCALYIATVNVKYGKGAPASSGQIAPEPSQLPTVSQLLHSANLNIKTFFESMKNMSDLFGLSDTVKSSLMSLKQKYLISLYVFDKFEMLFKKLFKSPDEISSSCDNGSCELSHDKRRICWLLYLLAKGTLLSECHELVLSLQIMLCCLEFTLSRALPFTIKDAFSSPRYDVESEETSLLRTVCREAGCEKDVSDVAMVKNSMFVHFIEDIPREDTHQDVESFPKLEFLEANYRQIYHAAGDIDEVGFLTYDPTLVTPGKSVVQSVPPSPDSTVSGQVFLTPVRRAITTVQALKSLLSGARNTPSDVLVRYFESCSVNPELAIKQRTEKLKELFVGHYVGVIGVQASELACTRFDQGLRLYYRIMEAMLIKEEKRLSTSDFSNLLNNDAFHRSLLACCVEIVMVTYTTSPLQPGVSACSSKLAFPWILDVFDLHPYNFIKVIESFIKDEPKLTEEARKHLHHTETQIVESLAWLPNSPLYDALRDVRGIEVNSNLEQSPRAGVVSQSTTAADMFLSPVRPGHYSKMRQAECVHPRPAHTANGGATARLGGHHGSPSFKPSQGGAEGQNCPSPRPSQGGARSVTLNKFFSKVLQLAYLRLHTMCGHLGIREDLEKSMWTCVEHCITNKPWLLRGRHLDQIIMCCIFGVCKVSDLELKFKRIVDMYRGLPHASSQTYKSVYMGANRDAVSIITFYNEIFIPNMKEFIYRFQPNATTPNHSPVPSRCQPTSTPGTTVYQLPGANLNIISMTDSPFRSPRSRPVPSPGQMTPQTRLLYSFGETINSEQLREFNQENTKRHHPTRRTAGKRLKLDDTADSDEGAGGSAGDAPPSGRDGGQGSESADDVDSGITRLDDAERPAMSFLERRLSQYASAQSAVRTAEPDRTEDDAKD
ncbi:retinoblastoma-associated protein-like [Diadema antillarum]|uniref:retinoblastoma-associated protein-like n=1 Tax=Diadema antillarum TaxID=105358 RepID=UPI003A84191E